MDFMTEQKNIWRREGGIPFFSLIFFSLFLLFFSLLSGLSLGVRKRTRDDTEMKMKTRIK